VASAVAAAGAARCTGTIYLSCPLAPRASVLIDGAATAHHHGDFVEVTCSAHAISFELADGRRQSRGASPTSANTRTSPLEVRCGLDGK
jgi:nitrite reductase/ring-hydroxylating ferredoxin subunit